MAVYAITHKSSLICFMAIKQNKDALIVQLTTAQVPGNIWNTFKVHLDDKIDNHGLYIMPNAPQDTFSRCILVRCISTLKRNLVHVQPCSWAIPQSPLTGSLGYLYLSFVLLFAEVNEIYIDFLVCIFMLDALLS